MNNWKNQLRKELRRQFSETELNEIIDYYEELINDRVERGESLNKVLKSYDPKTIKKEMLPTMIQKRDHSKVKTTSRSSWQILLILLSTPILLPLAIVYIALIIVALALALSGVLVMIATLIALIPYLIDIIRATDPLATTLAISGIGLIVLPLASLIGYGLFKISFSLTKGMVSLFSNMLARK